MNKSYTTVCGKFNAQPIEFHAINDWIYKHGIYEHGLYRFEATLKHYDIKYHSMKSSFTISDELLSFC